MDSYDSVIILLSAIAAAISFVAFALPMLNRGEKRAYYQSVIEKRRKDLFDQNRAELEKRGTKQALSARQSLSALFRVERMMGNMGEKVREQLLQAGIRSTSAPLKFIIARMILPVVLVGFCMLILSKSEKEISEGMTILILLAAAFAGYKLPSVLLKNKALKRAEEIGQTFPDALDMMLICVQGGIGLEQAVSKIAEEIAEHSPTLAEELGILSAEMAMLNDRRSALQDFAKRVGTSTAKTFSTALIQAEQYGTSVSVAMRMMADDLRDMRMQEAERKAASLPPKLTVPMILFFLPVLFIVILGPAILRAKATL